jgi:NurA-like 5'-3' nuclease
MHFIYTFAIRSRSVANVSKENVAGIKDQTDENDINPSSAVTSSDDVSKKIKILADSTHEELMAIIKLQKLQASQVFDILCWFQPCIKGFKDRNMLLEKITSIG